MISPTLMEIERCIRALSHEEQLWLLERIARHLREQTDKSEDLAAMASDPDIQTEIAAINEEFAMTETDGLA